MNVLKGCVMTTVLSALLVGGGVYAGEGHQHGHSHGHDQMAGMFLVKKSIDGYDVSFHVMEAQKGMEHGGSHNFMIKIEQGGKVLGDVKINSKVIHPNGKSESKPLMKMGDWYMNGYDLGHAGKHQMMILFKTANGQKHKGGVYYPDS